MLLDTIIGGDMETQIDFKHTTHTFLMTWYHYFIPHNPSFDNPFIYYPLYFTSSISLFTSTHFPAHFLSPPPLPPPRRRRIFQEDNWSVLTSRVSWWRWWHQQRCYWMNRLQVSIFDSRPFEHIWLALLFMFGWYLLLLFDWVLLLASFLTCLFPPLSFAPFLV